MAITDKTMDRLFVERVCNQYDIDISRFLDMRTNPMDGSYRLVFRGIPMPVELGMAMDELKALIDDEMRGAVLLASAPDTYHKINKALVAFNKASDRHTINISRHEAERYKHEAISRPPSYRT